MVSRALDTLRWLERTLAITLLVALVAVPEDQSGRHADFHRDFGRDRRLIGPAADTVGSEVFSSHAGPRVTKRGSISAILARKGLKKDESP